MRIIRGFSSLSKPLERSLCIIGNFDGLHLGHKQLIAFARHTSVQHGLSLTLLTFEPHSRMQLQLPFKLRIHSLYQKMVLLESLDIDRVILIRPQDHFFLFHQNNLSKIF